MHICIIKETREPSDQRTPLTPHQLAKVKVHYPEHQFSVESSPERCFGDEEYRQFGIDVITDISKVDILLGIKEVNPALLIKDKTYLFFTHTTKQQKYNRSLLQTASQKNITLIDYEHLSERGKRIISFGYWAGIVGAYNALRGYGLLTKQYELKPPQVCSGLNNLKAELRNISLRQPASILLTGEGRVASGATEILESMGIPRIPVDEFLNNKRQQSNYCQIGPQHYTQHIRGEKFHFSHFIQNPEQYKSAFQSYISKTNLLIAAHYWDSRAPVLFTSKEISNPEFKIQCIADISCDIQGSIPTTLRASTIENPFYGVDKETLSETEPFQENGITIMAVDNLPGALPREASEHFGERLIKHIVAELVSKSNTTLLNNATILKQGKLTQLFSYLKDYLEGN